MKHKGIVDFPLDKLNHQFITNYEFFFEVRPQQGSQHHDGYHQDVKEDRFCVANEWIDKDPFMSLKVKIRETNRPYLLQDELDKIML